MLSLLLLASLPFAQSGFAGETGWQPRAARAEIAPRSSVVREPSRGEPGALALSGGGNAAATGAWETQVDGVAPGRWYRLTAHYRTERVAHEGWQVVARLDWRDAAGARAGQPEYAWHARAEGGWTRVTLEAPAPEKAAAVLVQLQLRDGGDATVYWDDVALAEIAAPAPRPVKVAAVNLRPRDTVSREASVGAFLELARRDVPVGTDVVLFPEGMTQVGTGRTYAEVSESLPGPTTEALGALAREKKAWVVGGLYEREGAAVYNTAVLIDRDGRIAGKYRKVYLPREEVEGGLTAGSSYPTFATDFGTVGLLICWDVQFADPARALALGGAELLLMPIWGGNETLARARAIENRVFIASSGYDFPTQVIDPDGTLVAKAEADGRVATATIDLNARYVDPWLGDMRARLRKELRTDVVPPRP